MPLHFRQRILLGLILLGAVPTSLAIIGWALAVQGGNSSAARARAQVEAVGVSGRALLQTLDSTRLTPVEREALADHARNLNAALSRVQRTDAANRYYYAGLAAIILGLGGLVVFASVRVGGHLSRQLSRPIDELIGWTGYIQHRQPLPPDRASRGAPEFAALRTALRGMATTLEEARRQELEAERLRAFGEVARRVAHEMKNPLTPMRLAVAQLAHAAGPQEQELLEVITAESGRLEQMAREFTELGRLPEGPAAEVDLRELLTELTRTSLPSDIRTRLDLSPTTPNILGHYDALRRAFGNVLQNAVEACGGHGNLEVETRCGESEGAVVTIRDHGPGIRPELKPRIFDPYFTARTGGTGLGLTLVRQTVEAHGGTITAGDTPGGGATFVITLRGC